MERGRPLEEHLSAAGRGPLATAVADTVGRIARAASTLADILSRGRLDGDPGQRLGRGGGGDEQKALDVEADALFRSALLDTAVAVFASEEAEAIEVLNPDGSLCVALDPIDGSGNLDLNVPVGTIFSIVGHSACDREPLQSGAPFAWPAGTSQLAAGFVVYGPQTALVLTTGEAVDLFVLDRGAAMFRLAQQDLRLPDATPDEFAINSSNYRHWEEPIRAYVDECLAGSSGPYGRDFNMRWHGALVAEVYRVLRRGGVYLYPGDAREGYRDGRLRLVYEAYPMAFLVERAGGAASNGRCRILDIEAQSLHQRVPLILGSRPMVERLDALHLRPSLWPPTTAPLFASRGLFRS